MHQKLIYTRFKQFSILLQFVDLYRKSQPAGSQIRQHYLRDPLLKYLLKATPAFCL